MYKKENNYAFIDAQNVHRSIIDLGWKIDWEKFNIYLREKYSITKSFIFIGYIPENQKLYDKLKEFGFECVFKEVVRINKDLIKGNVDAELVLYTMIEINKFNKAVIVSGDGDFGCLVEYLHVNQKLKGVLVPNAYKYSKILKKKAKKFIFFLNDTRKILEL